MTVATTTGNILADLSVDAAELVHGETGVTAYSYAVDDATGTSRSLLIDLAGATPYSYTDCNGWVNYALNSAAPLHFAVASASRLSPAFNTTTTTGLALSEASEPFSRAFVLAHDFAAEPASGSGGSTDGFSQVTDFAELQAGDIIAYATGKYADPSDPALPDTTDTGHVMIVTGDPVSLGLSFDSGVSSIGGTDPVADIYAVSIVDSSDVVHAQTGTSGLGVDDRPLLSDTDKFIYAISEADKAEAPRNSDPKPGGLGTGTMYFAVDASGKAIGFKFNEHGAWQSELTTGHTAANGLLLTAARLDQTIDLSLLPSSSFNAAGQLEVTLMPNRDTGLVGTETETVSGTNGLLVDGTGTLTLKAANPDFSGGITLHGVGLDLAVAGAAGTAPITTDAGTANTLTIEAGSATVIGGGDDTISAATGGSEITGGAFLHFIGNGASTVDGGTGSATISGGAGGSYAGGSAGNNLIYGAGSSTLTGGGAGDQLHGGPGDLIVAASGNTTLFGGQNDVLVDNDRSFAFTGNDAVLFAADRNGSDVVAGTGDFLLVGRGGNTVVFGGSGDGTVWAGASHLIDVAGIGTGTLVAGAGHADLWINQDAGAQTVLALDGAGGGSITVLGFRAGTDHLATAGYGGAAAQSVSNGTLTVSLSDHTTITFVGVTSLG